jgi:hypothetical protein
MMQQPSIYPQTSRQDKTQENPEMQSLPEAAYK